MNPRTTHLWHVTATLTFALSLVLTACTGTTSSTGGTKTGGTMRPASEKVTATPTVVEDAWVQLAKTERAIANEWRNKSFEAFKATVYREPDGGKYIVNGDTPIVDRKHLQEFFEKNVQKSEPIRRGLIVNTSGGVDTAWSDTDKRNLTYCVSTAFGARRNQTVLPHVETRRRR